MKKQLYIIGVGMGKSSLSCEAKKLIKEVQMLFDFAHITEQLSDINGVVSFPSKAEDVAKLINCSKKTSFAVLLPGDPCFFSMAKEISDSVTDVELSYVAGISQATYFFSKCRIPWQDAKLIDARENSDSMVDCVRRNLYTFVLAKKNLRSLALLLCDAGFDELMVWVGENLGTKKEKLYRARPVALCVLDCPENTVMLIENTNYDRRIQIGTADCSSFNNDLPSLKPAVRAVLLSNLLLRENSICYCIGDYSPALASEIAMLAHEGRLFVFGSRETVDITNCNSAKHHIGNVFASTLPEEFDFSGFPVPSCSFIGGDDLDYSGIISALIKISPLISIVISCFLPLDASKAAQAINDAGREADICQLLVSQVKKKDGRNLTAVGELVYIISSSGVQESENFTD